MFGLVEQIYHEGYSCVKRASPLSSIGRLCVSFAGSVIASGGVGNVEDIKALQGLHHANLEGVIVGKALYESKFSLKDLL